MRLLRILRNHFHIFAGEEKNVFFNGIFPHKKIWRGNDKFLIPFMSCEKLVRIIEISVVVGNFLMKIPFSRLRLCFFNRKRKTLSTTIQNYESWEFFTKIPQQTTSNVLGKSQQKLVSICKLSPTAFTFDLFFHFQIKYLPTIYLNLIFIPTATVERVGKTNF